MDLPAPPVHEPAEMGESSVAARADRSSIEDSRQPGRAMGAREAIALCSFSSFTAPYLEALSSRDNNMSWRAVKDFR